MMTERHREMLVGFVDFIVQRKDLSEHQFWIAASGGFRLLLVYIQIGSVSKS